MNDSERRIVGLFCFALTLTWQQWDRLRRDQLESGSTSGVKNYYIALESPRTKNIRSNPEFPFLSAGFGEQLDETQLRFMHIAEAPVGAYAGLFVVDDPLQQLIDKFEFEMPSLLSSSQDEAAIEEILADIFGKQSNRITQRIQFSLSTSQKYMFALLRQKKLPLKYLLFSLSQAQRQDLLQLVFVGIFQDEAHPNPNEAYALIKLYVSYFALSEEGLPKRMTRFDYVDWFIQRR